MHDLRYRWIKIAANITDIPFGINGIAEVAVDDKVICVIQSPDGLRACAGKCPHAGAPLRDGVIDSRGNILCCVHNYRFSLTHGRDPFNEYFLKIYPVREEADGIFLGI